MPLGTLLLTDDCLAKIVSAFVLGSTVPEKI